MRDNRDLDSGRNRSNYIPNDEIDREERDDRDNQRGSTITVLLGAVIVISLLAFLFVLLDSGVLAGRTETLYGSPETVTNSGSNAAAQEEEQRAKEEEEARRKAEEEEAQRLAEEEEEAKKQAEEEKAKKKEEEKKKKEEEEEKAREEEEEREREEEEQRQREEAERMEAEIMAGDYILPDSNARYYSESEISPLTDTEVIYAINEIYARKGRIFSGDEYREYFESKSWYKGTIPPEEFDADQESYFNEYEKANLALLIGEAQNRGLR